MPAVANLVGTRQDERIRRGFWRALRLLTLAAFPLVAGVGGTGPALLELAYGSEYADAGPVLLAMLAPPLLQPMLRVSEGVLYGLVAGLAATVVDIGLVDAIGAAIANGVAILVTGVPCLVLAWRLHRRVSLAAGPLLRTVVLWLLVAGAAWLALEGLGTLAAVAAGLLAGVGATLLPRPLAGEDAEWLSAALGGDGARGRAARFVARLGAPS